MKGYLELETTKGLKRIELSSVTFEEINMLRKTCIISKITYKEEEENGRETSNK